MSDTADRAGDSVLGTLLRFYKPELIVIVQARGVAAKDFWRDRQRVVYRAVLALHAQGSHVDRLTLEAFLASHSMQDRAPGSFLDLLETSSVPSALKEHASIVAESGRWDRLMRACGVLSRAVESRDDEALREAVALVKRDVSEDAPRLRVVKDDEGAAA